MVQRGTLIFLLLVYNRLIFVLKAAKCPENCHTKAANSCRCPDPNWKSSPCSLVGHGGPYNFPACLDAIPTDFSRGTVSVLIQHLSSPTLLEESFQNLPFLLHLSIRMSNVSTIQPGAFRGLRHLTHLYLVDNRVSGIEPDTFIGIGKLRVLLLEKNAISAISQHGFRGLAQLRVLRLSGNRLTSVPVTALLDLRASVYVDLQRNHIATIDRDVVRLKYIKGLNLKIRDNKLRCDKDLTWFICSLPDLPYISGAEFLKCASPPDLFGASLTTMEIELCKTKTDRPQQEIGSKPFSEHSTTTESRNVHSSPHIPTTHPYSDSIPTEEYTEILTVSEHTTQMDNVNDFGEDPVIKKDVNITLVMITALITAVVVPPLLVLTMTALLFILKLCRGTDLPHHDGSYEEATSSKTDNNIEPYAVSYADSAELKGHDRNSTTNRLPSPDDSHTIEPYQVTYDDQTGSQLQSNAADSVDDPAQEDNYEAQPYAVGYPEDSPQATRSRAEASLTPQENGTDGRATDFKRPVVQSLTNDESKDSEDEEEEGESDSTGDGKGPYGKDEGHQVPGGVGLQYQSGSQANKGGACSVYNPPDGRIQTSGHHQSVLYEDERVDTGLPH
ncbi:PREDICTED: uncharacterized protein LOC109482835 [Branchiostoma belcheri]|uniref:Uncharacterized protein LOC109482835 n=1 Tax=Branchiostoma belcheri TaxID=7741 RepID=A0A6P5AD66_BRABE|nr:PREDICTED: uncharacterized protein LOC109482835 [Branchiostoma belcheri]